MSGLKLYGNYAGAFESKRGEGKIPGSQEKRPVKRTALDRVLSILMILVVLEGLYCTLVFSNIGFIKKYRDLWIQTAMSTMSHHWLATAFIPSCVIDDVMLSMQAARDSQIGVNSDQSPTGSHRTPNGVEEDESIPDTPEGRFYKMFWEIDPQDMQNYLDEHPDLLANGWENIYVNEAGLDDDGLDLKTIMGEQVLAIDAKNQILVVRVEGSGYKGVLAIAKNSEQLALYPAARLGTVGQYTGEIAAQHNGVIAMTGSSFIDNGGMGNGGTLAGYAMMDGEEYGKHMSWSYKRLELHEDNRFYITDTQSEVSPLTTDAVEFTPALIVDGVTLVDENNFWNGINPRACMGQTEKDEFLMLVIEGRGVGGSIGTGVVECASILARHDCRTAMNLDGGSSAIMWYDGEYITRCSNKNASGRQMPNAFVYKRVD